MACLYIEGRADGRAALSVFAPTNKSLCFYLDRTTWRWGRGVGRGAVVCLLLVHGTHSST